MRLLLTVSLLAPAASAFFFGTIPPVQYAYARPEAGAAPPCAPCELPTLPPLPTFAPLELPTLAPLQPIELPTFAPLPTAAPFEWPTFPPQAAAAQGYVQPPKPLEPLPTAAPLVLPTLPPLEPLPTMAPIELPTLPPFELPKLPDAYVQPKPLELPTLPPLEPLPTLAPFTFPPLEPLPTLAPFEFPKLPEGYVQPPQPLPTAAPLVLPTLPPLEPLPTMAPLVLPTLPPFELPKAPDAYVQPKPIELPTLAPIEFPTLPPYKAPEPVYIQPLEFPTFAPLAPLPTLAPFEWPTFAPLPAGGYATAPPQYVTPAPVPQKTNDIVTETGSVGGQEAVEAAEASAVDQEVAPPPPAPEEEVAVEGQRWERAPADCTDFLGYLTSVDCWLAYQPPVPEGVQRPEIPTEPAAFAQTNEVSDVDLVEHDSDKPTFEKAIETSKLRLRRGSMRHLNIQRIA